MRPHATTARLLFLILFIVTQPTHSNAAPEVRVIKTHPEAGITLGIGQALYLHLAYDSAQPLRFQATAASERGLMMNPSLVYPAGRGEAIVWLAYRETTRLDSVGVKVFDARWQPLTRLDIEKPFHWSNSVTDIPPRPAWVEQTSGKQQAQVSTELNADQQGNTAGSLLIMLMGWSVPGYFVLQWLVWRRWHDNWRRAGLLPLWVSVPVIGWSLFALLAGSSLWPLVMLFVMPLLLLYLLILFLIRSIRSQKSSILR